VWQIFRSFYQMTRRPYVIGGAALLTGYFWAMLHRYERSVGRELLLFQRQDQMRRLRKFFGLGNAEVVSQDKIVSRLRKMREWDDVSW
jgi:hypothetical protein